MRQATEWRRFWVGAILIAVGVGLLFALVELPWIEEHDPLDAVLGGITGFVLGQGAYLAVKAFWTRGHPDSEN
jgi:hypothetical protein